MGLFDLFRPDVPQLASRQDIEGLIRSLSYNDPVIQDEAARALRSFGKKSVPAILQHLQQPEDTIKCRLVQILLTSAQIPPSMILPVIRENMSADPESFAAIFDSLDEHALPCLLSLSSDKNPTIRELAIDAMANMHEQAWPFLKDTLSSRSYLGRQSAATALLQSGWKPRTEEEYIRFNIAKGDWKELIRMKKSSVEALVAMLSDEYYGIRRDAARALGAIGDTRAVLPLCNSIADPDPEVCIGVIEALQELRDRRALGLLVKTLQHPSYNVRRAAAQALENLHWSPATDNDRIQFLIASEQWQALAARGKTVVPILVQALGDDYYSVRQGAAEALRSMGSLGKNALLEATHHENPTIQRTATDFLARINSGPQPAENNKPGRESQNTNNHSKPGIRELPAQKKSAIAGSPDSTVNTPPKRVPLERSRVQESPVTAENKTRDTLPAQSPRSSEKTPPGAERALPDLPPVRENERPGKTILQVPDPAAVKPEPVNGRDLSAIIAALHNPDPNVRVVAIESIVKFSDEAIDSLIAALADPDYTVRHAAAEALGRLRNERAVPALTGLLADPDESVRAAAAGSLGAIGDLQALAPIVRLLSDNYEQVRCAAVEGLAGLGTPAIPFLLQLLGHTDPQIRAGIATTLGMIGAREACNPLSALFADTDPVVREQAAAALGRIGVPAIPRLAEALGSADAQIRLCGVNGLGIVGDPGREFLAGACNDPDPVVRDRARELIGLPADTSKAEPVTEAEKPVAGFLAEKPLHDKTPLSHGELLENIRLISHPNKDIQIRAVTAIVQAGDSAVVPLVDALISEKNEIRAGAAEALVEIGSSSVMPLIKALGVSPPDARIWILHALGKLGDRQAVGEISGYLDDADPRVRLAATDALGYIGDPAITPRLGKILTDPDDQIRASAVRALGYIGDPASVPSLVIALGDEEYHVREMAQEALFEIGTPAIPDIVDALKSRFHEVREGAAESLDRLGWKPGTTNETAYYLMAQESWMDLARMGDEAIPPLSNALDTTDDDLRMGVVLTLGKMEGAETIGLLARVLTDKNVMIRQKATMALVDMGTAARPTLSSVGSSAPPDLQQAILQVISRIDRKCQS